MEMLAPDPRDEDARRLLDGFEYEANEHQIEHPSGHLHLPCAFPVVVHFPDRDVLEFFPSEESGRSSAVAPAAGAGADGPDEKIAAAVAVARIPRQATRRFRPTLATAATILAVFALIGLIGLRIIRVAPGRPEVHQSPLLESAGTVAIGSIVPVPARLPIEPQARVDPVSTIGPTHEQLVPPAPLAAASVIPPADAPRSETVTPAPASTSDSPKAMREVPASEPLPLLPPTIEPGLPQPETPPTAEQRPAAPVGASISAETPGVPSDRSSIQDVLNRYQHAFNSLDASAAKALWPSVDERALGRAFDQLSRQAVVFDACKTAVTGRLAVSACQGHASYVPKIGNKMERTEAGRWTFKLRKGDSGWLIDGVESR
jgi:hypothetical protein